MEMKGAYLSRGCYTDSLIKENSCFTGLEVKQRIVGDPMDDDDDFCLCSLDYCNSANNRPFSNVKWLTMSILAVVGRYFL